MNRPDPPVPANFPILPEMFSNALPPQVPPMTWDSGVVEDWIRNWKLGRMEKSAARLDAISLHQRNIAANTLAMMTEFITWQAKTADVFHDFEAKKQIRDAEVAEKNFKNTILYYEVEQARMDYERRRRDYEAETRQ